MVPADQAGTIFAPLRQIAAAGLVGSLQDDEDGPDIRQSQAPKGKT